MLVAGLMQMTVLFEVTMNVRALLLLATAGLLGSLVCGLTPQLCAADRGDWPSWRGPQGNGIAAAGQTVATSWSETENVLWKASVPGRGHSSPIVVGQHVFLTTADRARQVQSVLCYDRANGEKLWQTDVNSGGFPEQIHKKNTHASPTLACDGQRLFAVFHNHQAVQLTALDLAGKILWQKNAGPYRPQRYRYGYAPSPLLYQSTVIISAEYERQAFLAAFESKTGQEVWRQPRPATVSYSSPIVARLAGQDQLVLSGGMRLSSYNPQTGKPLWSTRCIAPATCGTAVWDDDIVFASGGYPQRETVGVRADGSGKVLWKNNKKCYEQSMLAHDGYVYAVDDGGIAYCWRATDGEEMWKQRLGGSVSASPILVEEMIYLSNEAGTTFVFKADPQKFQLVAKNQLGDEAFATPTICGNQIFLRVAKRKSGRRQEMLYCIADGQDR